MNTIERNTAPGGTIESAKWYRLKRRNIGDGKVELGWPDGTRQMWKDRLQGRIGLTTDEFSRVGRGGCHSIDAYKIYVFYPENIPITGHCFFHRKMKEALMLLNYEHCRNKITFSKVQEYSGTGALAIQSKYVLRKLAEKSPLFAKIWEDLKNIDPDECGIYLADAPDAAWLASIQSGESHLFAEFRNPLGVALAGMESVETNSAGRECLAAFIRIQQNKPFDDVKMYFERMVRQAGNFYEFWECYVFYLLSHEMADWASDAVGVAQKNYPDCLMLDKLGAYCSMENGDWRGAERHVQRYLEANPWDPWIIGAQARLAFNRRDYSSAARHYEERGEHRSLDYEDMLNYGFALLMTRRCEESLAIYMKMDLRFGPGPTIFNNIGMALAALGRWQESVVYSRRALDADPTYRFAWDTLGFAYLRGGQHPEAIHALLKAIELEPNYPDAWRHLLHAYHKDGDADRLEGAKTYVGQILPEELARFEREKGTEIQD